MVKYYIKREVESVFDMDNGVEVSRVSYHVCNKVRLWSGAILCWALCLFIFALIYDDSSVFFPFGIIGLAFLGFSISCLFPHDDIRQSFDSRFKAENYIKYLKKGDD